MDLLTVIKQIAPELEKEPNIHALWLEGSWATGNNNEHSDIDVWLDIDDGTFSEVIDKFREAIVAIGDIDWEKSRGMYSRDPNLVKHTFHLSGYPEQQMIEVDMQEHSREFVFKRGESVLKVIFDKDNTIKWST